MKRKIFVVACIAILVVGYAVWPLAGLAKIAAAVEAKDYTELSARIDRVALKRSLAAQVARTYLKVSGKDAGRNSLEAGFILQAAIAMADSHVEQLLTPESLSDLLREGGTQTFAGGAEATLAMPKIQKPNMRNFLGFIRNARYAGSDFYLILPLRADAHAGYRLHLGHGRWRV